MKKVIIILFLIIAMLISAGCALVNDDMADCVRIHIRANSNEEIDQNVKLLVRDAVVTYLTPVLAECESAEEAKQSIRQNIPALTDVANECLRSENFDYVANVALTREEFPYREYLNYSFPSGIYDALIIKLGKGGGNNWWCVCFPPLCFVPDGEDDENFSYKSKIMEIIKKSRG